MHGFGPQFIDITWGAGGRHSKLTTEMVKVAQSTSEFNFDDSRLARTKDLVSDISARIDVAEKLVNAETTYPGEIDLDEAEKTNITEQVTKYFEASSQADESVAVKLD